MNCQIKGCQSPLGASEVLCKDHWIAARRQHRLPLVERISERDYKLVGWQEIKPGEPARNLPL